MSVAREFYSGFFGARHPPGSQLLALDAGEDKAREKARENERKDGEKARVGNLNERYTNLVGRS